MYTNHRALFNLTVVDGEVMGQDGTPFDRVAYSRFKYGYLPPAIRYGQGLARLIADELFATVGYERITIVSAPYKYLPTASDAIARSLLQELTRRAALDGESFPVLVPFNKANAGDSSYASSTHGDRVRMLASLGLSIDQGFVRGSHVIVVDDIRITGTAEATTAQYLQAMEPAGIWYVHAARLDPEVGMANPQLEHKLNMFTAHPLLGFLMEDHLGEFRLNTRALRFILESDHEEFASFIDAASDRLLTQMYESAVGNGHAYFARYRMKLDMIVRQLQFRQLILANH